MSYVTAFDGLLWVLVALVVFVFLQRFLHREIQAFFLILTRSPGVTQVLFALIFFPGVVLHELSHFLIAKLLWVRTGRFSLPLKSNLTGNYGWDTSKLFLAALCEMR